MSALRPRISPSAWPMRRSAPSFQERTTRSRSVVKMAKSRAALDDEPEEFPVSWWAFARSSGSGGREVSAMAGRPFWVRPPGPERARPGARRPRGSIASDRPMVGSPTVPSIGPGAGGSESPARCLFPSSVMIRRPDRNRIRIPGCLPGGRWVGGPRSCPRPTPASKGANREWRGSSRSTRRGLMIDPRAPAHENGVLPSTSKRAGIDWGSRPPGWSPIPPMERQRPCRVAETSPAAGS